MITANPRSFRATPRARVRISHELYVRCCPILPVFSERGVVRRHGDSGNGRTGNLVRLIPSLILRKMVYAIRRYRMEVMPFSKRRMTWLAQRNFTKMFTKWGGTRELALQTYAAFRHVLVTCWLDIYSNIRSLATACLGYRPHSNLALVWLRVVSFEILPLTSSPPSLFKPHKSMPVTYSLHARRSRPSQSRL